jgi:hypothetical protein
VILCDALLDVRSIQIVQDARAAHVSEGIHNGLRARKDAEYAGQHHTRAPHTLVFAPDASGPARLSPRFTGRHQAAFSQTQPHVRLVVESFDEGTFFSVF